MGFFSSGSGMSCSRRTFLKGLFSASVVAIAVPKALADGRYVVKLEKRFKPGEFVYVEYGKHIPIHVLSEEEAAAALVAEDITWDGSDEAIRRRTNLMKDLMMSLYEIETVSQFDKSLEGLYDFLIAIESAFENAYIILEFMDVGQCYRWLEYNTIPRSVNKKLANHLIVNPKFVAWRQAHIDKFMKSHCIGKRTITIKHWHSEEEYERKIDLYEEEDMNLLTEMVNAPDHFSELLFTNAERKHILKVISNPSHWLYDPEVSKNKSL